MASQKIAKPPHIRLKGIRVTSEPRSRRPPRGRPFQRMRSPDPSSCSMDETKGADMPARLPSQPHPWRGRQYQWPLRRPPFLVPPAHGGWLPVFNFHRRQFVAEVTIEPAEKRREQPRLVATLG